MYLEYTGKYTNDGECPKDKEVNFKKFHYKIWDRLSSEIKFQITVTNKNHQTETEFHGYISVSMSDRMPILTEDKPN